MTEGNTVERMPETAELFADTAKTSEGLTESSNPESANLSEMSISEIVALMNRQDHNVVMAVQKVIPAVTALAEAVFSSIQQKHRLFYIGAGTSGRLGVLDASECPPTFGVGTDVVVAIIAGGVSAVTKAVENAEDDRQAGARALRERGLTAGDVVVGISASGTTPYVCGGLEYAHSIGAVTGSIFCNPGAPLGKAQYPVLIEVGAEVLRGSTRLKAGTATKMVLNMLSTSVMVKLGHCIGDLMVDVAANNSKLVERQAHILADIRGFSLEEARSRLKEVGGDMRKALRS